MTFGEYREAPGENLSRLKLLEDSPRKYMVNPRKDTSALGIGRAIHTAVLEPDLFESEYVTWHGGRRGTKAYKEFEAASDGREILSADERYICDRVADAVTSHDVANAYFDDGAPEQAVFWTHPLGVECKSRIDWLREDCIIDLKSARDVSKHGFARSAASFDYAAQCAFYHDAAKAVDGRDRKVILLAVEKEEPFDVVPYVVPEEAIVAGRRRYTDWLLLLMKCRAADHWPGVSETETDLHLPAWYFDEMDDAKLVIGGVEVAV